MSDLDTHSVYLQISAAMANLEKLRDMAIDMDELKLVAYLRAACKCCELALMEAQAKTV
jgi:hypothetical protein